MTSTGPDDTVQDGWLAGEAARLLAGARAARAEPGGFWWLDDAGRPDRSRPRELWIGTRMTHVFALGLGLGRDGDAELVDHGIAALISAAGVDGSGGFRDPEHGGWFAAVDDSGPVAGPKGAYEHAFVLLAASSATLAGRPGARELLAEAERVVLDHFWDEDTGAMVEEWDRSWTRLDPYRGTNANMHSVEAFLAAADATGDPGWRQRALRIATRIVHGEGRAHGWRLPEHHDQDWTVLPEYNADAVDHPFRPYGVTPGHGLEWARLMLHLAAGLAADGAPVPEWLQPSAVALFERAVADGWDQQRGGFCYTTDWAGVPVVEQRFHWVICEAIGTAAALHRVTGESRFADWYQRFWAYARRVFIDPDVPGWLHEAEPDGRPSRRTWSGRPDTYHALQATLVPRLPLYPCLAAAAPSLRV